MSDEVEVSSSVVAEDSALSSGASVGSGELVSDPFVSVADTGTMSGVSSGAGVISHESGVDSGSTVVSADMSRDEDSAVSSASSGDAEVPSARDGVAVDLAARGAIVYSTGVCPLLADDDAIRSEVEKVSVGSVDMVSRSPKQVLTNPVTCPTCKVQVDSHQLVFDNAHPGVRDCAMAISHRAHPVSRELLAASDDGNTKKAERIAARHPLGRRILEILGFVPKREKVS